LIEELIEKCVARVRTTSSFHSKPPGTAFTLNDEFGNAITCGTYDRFQS
jgi:hypothetical protein